MRSYHLLVAAALLLAAPLAAAAQCSPQGKVNITAQREAMGAPSGRISTGTQLADEVAGSYALSNGHRLDLIHLDQRLIAEFDKRRRVQLEEVGPHLFASRSGDVEMAWMPGQRADTILLSYPADDQGRLRRSCS
ncbi:hypothetical protein [Massilia sp.]|uniref:hypothetical protein n=1 Tax=Massilia sp. TaxID=1882437 RepID=UPI00391BDB93